MPVQSVASLHIAHIVATGADFVEVLGESRSAAYEAIKAAKPKTFKRVLRFSQEVSQNCQHDQTYFDKAEIVKQKVVAFAEDHRAKVLRQSV